MVLLSMMKSGVSLTFSQTVEQIDFVEEVSNLNDSVTSKNQGDKTAFFRKNFSWKKKIDTLLSLIFADDGQWLTDSVTK